MRRGRYRTEGPELVRRQCANPRCRRWYDARAWRIRQGQNLYCGRQCAHNAQAKFKWFVCLQCGLHFRRARAIYRRRPCKFCSQWCYEKHRLGVELDEDWRTFPLDP